MMNIKEKKDMDDAFKKAQKPWAKLLQKVEKAKSDYHTACKSEKSAANQERNAAGDSSISADQVSEEIFFKHTQIHDSFVFCTSDRPR
jgi:fructose-1,6-bisphosphatase